MNANHKVATNFCVCVHVTVAGNQILQSLKGHKFQILHEYQLHTDI